MKNKTYCISFLSFLSTFSLLLLFYSSFYFSFPFSLFSSLFLFISPHFFLSPLVLFLPLFGEIIIRSMGGNFLPSFLKPSVWLSFFHPFLLFLNPTFMTSSPTWLNMSHEFLSYTWLNCEPLLFMPSVTLLWCQVSPFLRCHVASPYLAMCHPTPHVSKNVKSRPPQNSTKFNVVAKFRETISTEKSVSSSEI